MKPSSVASSARQATCFRQVRFSGARTVLNFLSARSHVRVRISRNVVPFSRRQGTDMSLDAVDLAAELIRFDTINPPGQEAACTDYLALLLTTAGFHCETVLLAVGRPNLVARIGGNSAKPPIAFTGHTDTVPLGARAWSVPPHEGLVNQGRLWGRGASDMKSGVSAFVVAA